MASLNPPAVFRRVISKYRPQIPGGSDSPKDNDTFREHQLPTWKCPVGVRDIILEISNLEHGYSKDVISRTYDINIITQLTDILLSK